jgi:hypothetical protein
MKMTPVLSQEGGKRFHLHRVEKRGQCRKPNGKSPKPLGNALNGLVEIKNISGADSVTNIRCSLETCLPVESSRRCISKAPRHLATLGIFGSTTHDTFDMRDALAIPASQCHALNGSGIVVCDGSAGSSISAHRVAETLLAHYFHTVTMATADTI